MNCKSCIHFNVCAKAKNPENYGLQMCKDFKDKENYTEVVRCKDCVYYLPLGVYYQKREVRACIFSHGLFGENGFCCEGIRKDGEGK